VGEDADEHSHADDGDGLLRGGPELLERQQRKYQRGKPAGPNQPTNRTVPRSRPAPTQERATGSMCTKAWGYTYAWF
jgi:hypothetical protein